MSNIIYLVPIRLTQAVFDAADRHDRLVEPPKLTSKERARRIAHTRRMLAFAEAQSRSAGR